MTVKELIEKLQDLSPEARVVLRIWDHVEDCSITAAARQAFGRITTYNTNLVIIDDGHEYE